MFTVYYRCLCELHGAITAAALSVKSRERNGFIYKCYIIRWKCLTKVCGTVLVKMTAYVIITEKATFQIWKKRRTLSSVYQSVATFKFPSTHFFCVTAHGIPEYARRSKWNQQRRKFKLIQSPIWNSWCSDWGCELRSHDYIFATI